VAKAIIGAAMITGAVAMAIASGGTLTPLAVSLLVSGISMEAGAIADMLTSNRGQNITTRQPASTRQIVYGMQRVGGIQVYQSTTGSKHDQYNFVIVLATHEIYNISDLYLDGRRVHWSTTTMGPTGYTQDPRNGVTFGGNSDGNNYNGPNGQQYNFGGPLVFCSPWFGDQPDGSVDGNLTANDPHWAATGGKSPWGGGCAYVYLKIEYSQDQFQNLPEIRFTVNGKNDIYDPRTSSSGYSQNWALCVADVLTDPTWGLGDNTVNQAQLIAAANVCDEQVTLAAGGTESRYSLNWHYDTSVSPGNALSEMVQGADGRLSRIGGQWYLWPAYYQGPSFSMDDSIQVAPIQWEPNRDFDQLNNRVTGTYIAPNYPYNVAGNLYDSNGWYDGTVENNFPFAFQPTNFPQYAADVLHGYSSDTFLTEDLGVPLPKEVTFGGVLSISQAQRVAKIMLMRNRQQGTGTLTCNLAAWQLQPTDVFYYTSAAMGWTNKLLEVTAVRFIIDADRSGGKDAAQSIYVELSVQETDPSVYNWSTTEELSVYDVPVSTLGAPWTVAAPTVMTLTSGASTAVVSANGNVTPRVQVSWDAPLDIQVTQIAIQYKESSSSTWLDAPSANVASLEAYVSGVIAGVDYDFQIASVRASGAMSQWVSILNYDVSITLNVQGTDGISEASLVGEVYTSSTAGIVVDPFTAIVGNFSVSCLSSPYTILTDGTIGGTGADLLPATQYWVYYIDPTFAGGAITPIATTNTTDFDNKIGYFLIGSVTTLTYVTAPGGGGGGGAGAIYRPSNFNDVGTRTTTTPAAAYDGNSTSYAYVSASSTPSIGSMGVFLGQNTTFGQCIFEDFPAIAPAAGTTLTVNAATSGTGSGTVTYSYTITATVGSTTTSLATITGNTSNTAYTLAIAAGVNLSTVVVSVTAQVSVSPTGSPGFDGATDACLVYEISIA
jgi:hypothetical protein